MEGMNYLYMSNEVIEMREEYRQREYAFWREYLPNIMNGNVAWSVLVCGTWLYMISMLD